MSAAFFVQFFKSINTVILLFLWLMEVFQWYNGKTVAEPNVNSWGIRFYTSVSDSLFLYASNNVGANIDSDVVIITKYWGQAAIKAMDHSA